ncbi:MAG TPA: Gfo/Idh/MocA family oxidoreductase [Spirochaetia bacterium]|nr:Gfo/Idh/MocA family oxidoreductase [Spirochaetia bacterium]
MEKKKVRFGIIGLGLMGKEFGSSVARWCHLLDDGPVPVITGICDVANEAAKEWFKTNFPTIEIVTTDYHDLLASDRIDAIYCAVPHNLHEKIYIETIRAKKHLFGEKPFGIDKKANDAIMRAVAENPEVIVRASSEFPYFPAAKMVTEWAKMRKYGRLIEVRSGFHHSSDMDLTKPINWKRMVAVNGEYGCMGDLGLHTHHIPFRLGWIPKTVYADLSKIAEQRPDGKGNMVPCETWDNAILSCKADDPASGKEFSIIFETKRMQPGATNNWFIEVYGTQASFKFSSHDPKAFYYTLTEGKEQGWTRIDVGSQSYVPSITGGIFEFGFSDAYQQMLAAFLQEFRDGGSQHPFKNVMPEETALSHKLLTGALESHKTGRRITL